MRLWSTGEDKKFGVDKLVFIVHTVLISVLKTIVIRNIPGSK